MRSYKALVILGVAAMVCTVIAFWGCSNNNNSVNWGNPSNPEYLEVDAQLNEFVDSTLNWFADGLGTIASLPTGNNVDPAQYGPGDPGATTDSLSVSYTGGWHIIYLLYHHSSGYTAFSDDSIQFIVGGQPAQTPAGLEQLLYHHRWSWTAPDTTVTFRNISGHNSFNFAGLQTNQATANGTNAFASHAKYVTNDSTISRDITIEASFSNFKIDKTQAGWAQGCPASGTATVTITMTYQKNTDNPITTTWTSNLSFDHGLVSVTTQSAGQTWSYHRRECWAPGSY